MCAKVPGKNKKEAPLNDENLYEGTVFARVFLKKIPRLFCILFLDVSGFCIPGNSCIMSQSLGVTM